VARVVPVIEADDANVVTLDKNVDPLALGLSPSLDSEIGRGSTPTARHNDGKEKKSNTRHFQTAVHHLGAGGGEEKGSGVNAVNLSSKFIAGKYLNASGDPRLADG
jgi:hypothetical protein